MPEGPLLAIESSCDDSAAAVLSPAGEVLSNVVHSQDAIHERYGGVVPEVASRAHVERMSAVVREALRPGRRGYGRSGRSGRHRGPWTHRRAAGRGADRQSHRVGPPSAALPGQPSPRSLWPRSGWPTARRLFPWSPSWRRAGTRRWSPLTTGRPTGCSDRPWTTPPERPSTREPVFWAWATRAEGNWTNWPREATRRPSRSRWD